MINNIKTILVYLTAYMEPELEHTVKSFYDLAKFKNRLLFSVVSQDEDFPDLSFIPKHQIRYLKINADETHGYMWSKKIASVQFSDFDYAFCIDGHMFPQQDWDAEIIESYEEAKKMYGKCILNVRPIGYKIENGVRKHINGDDILKKRSEENQKKYFNRYAKKFNENAAVGVGDWWPSDCITKNDFEEIYYIWASCVFSERDFLDCVPVDPDISFYHEERNLSIRAIKNNYKIIYFKFPNFYHMYAKERNDYIPVVRQAIRPNSEKDIELEKVNRYQDFIKNLVDEPYKSDASSIEKFYRMGK